jgi:phage virion morphogenesis protein
MTGAMLTFDAELTLDALDRLYAAAGDLRPVLKNIGEYETQSTKDRFGTETDPQGRPWPDLNPLYALTKKGSGKLKGETGRLAQIFYQLADESAVDIGSDIIYARIHNEGGKIVPKSAAALFFSMGGQEFRVQSVTIPQRQFLGFSDADMAEILAVIEDHFVMAAGSGGTSP